MTLIFNNVNGSGELYIKVLNSLTGSKRDSFLDIGCNHAPFTPQLGFKERTYIDILTRELDYKEEQKYFIQSDALEYLNKANTCDVIYSLDQIEHVTKEYGWKQIDAMFMHSDRIVLFTPLDEWMMTNDEDKNPESHRSIWKPNELDETWIKLIFPHYHPTLNIGAWFFMKCVFDTDTKLEFERIKTELKHLGYE